MAKKGKKGGGKKGKADPSEEEVTDTMSHGSVPTGDAEEGKEAGDVKPINEELDDALEQLGEKRYSIREAAYAKANACLKANVADVELESR